MLDGKVRDGGWQTGPLSSRSVKFPGETLGTMLVEDIMSVTIHCP